MMKKYIALTLVAGLAIVATSKPLLGQMVRPDGIPDAQGDRLAAVIGAASAADFLKASQEFWKQEREQLAPGVRKQVESLFGQRGKEFIEQAASLEELPGQDLHRLLGWASGVMTEAEKIALLGQARDQVRTPTESSFESLESSVAVMDQLLPRGYVERGELRSAIAAWLSARDISVLPGSQLLWCHRKLASPIRGTQGFSAVWEGFVSAPRAGEYRFSASPWRLSRESLADPAGEFHRQSLKVFVDSKNVLSMAPSEWPSQAEVVSLPAGQPLPIRVEFNYVRNDAFHLCPVVLKWSGPGIAESVVPASQFSRDLQGASGLASNFTWRNTPDANESSYQGAALNIDFHWTDGFVPNSDEDSVRLLSEVLTDRWCSSDGDFIGDVARRGSLVSLLKSDQLARCLQSAASSASYKGVDATRFWSFWMAVRSGAEREAVDVLGLWMQQHPNDLPQLAVGAEGYFETNLKLWRRYAVCFGYENPDLLAKLEEFIEAGDGSCVLPAAYTCAYSYLQQDRFDEWVSKLDQRLSDDQLVGDKRVNWLVARAMADEIRHEPREPFAWGVPRLGEGRDWLIEAALASQSPQVQTHVAAEQIARQVGNGDLDGAEERIAKIESLQQWSEAVPRLRERALEERRQQRLASDRAFVEEIRRRQQLAAKRRDDQAQARYSEIMSSLPESK